MFLSSIEVSFNSDNAFFIEMFFLYTAGAEMYFVLQYFGEFIVNYTQFVCIEFFYTKLIFILFSYTNYFVFLQLYKICLYFIEL